MSSGSTAGPGPIQRKVLPVSAVNVSPAPVLIVRSGVSKMALFLMISVEFPVGPTVKVPPAMTPTVVVATPSPIVTEKVSATVALSRTFGYATDLRSLTRGRGTFSMEISHFEPAEEAMKKFRG